MLFCKHFHIMGATHKLSKAALPALFKKESGNSKELTFHEFVMIIEKIAQIMYEDDNTLAS
jgi:hypothetical protein